MGLIKNHLSLRTCQEFGMLLAPMEYRYSGKLLPFPGQTTKSQFISLISMIGRTVLKSASRPSLTSRMIYWFGQMLAISFSNEPVQLLASNKPAHFTGTANA